MAYHPQTDGQTEWMVLTLEEMLRHYVSNSQHDWTDYLSSLEFAYNNSVQASNGYTPFELDIGYHPLTPHTIDNPDSHNVQAFDEFKESLDVIATLAQDSIRKVARSLTSLTGKDILTTRILGSPLKVLKALKELIDQYWKSIKQDKPARIKTKKTARQEKQKKSRKNQQPTPKKSKSADQNVITNK
jgi:hypothetical protein